MPECIFLCNSSVLPIVESHSNQQAQVFSDSSTFGHYLRARSLSEVDHVYVQLELDWYGDAFTDFKGLALLADLRKDHKLLCPITLFTDLPLSFIRRKASRLENRFFRYLKDPSVDLVRIYDLIRQAEVSNKKRPALNEETLNFLLESIYCEKGFVMEVIADFVGEIGHQEPDSYLDINSFKNLLNTIINCFPKHAHQIRGAGQEILASFKTRTQDDYVGADELRKKVDQLREVLCTILPREVRTEQSGHRFIPRMKALYIEDEQPLSEKVVELLKGFNVECATAKSATEALEILKNDPLNEIGVVICDYRLYDQDKKLQPLQGFQIIKKLASLPNFISVIALVNDGNAALMQMPLNHNGTVFQLIKSKVFASREGLKQLGQLVSELIGRNYKILHNLPNFNDDQKRLYRKHRESMQYQQIESDISAYALQFVMALKNGEPIDTDYTPRVNGKLNLKNDERNLDNMREVLLGRRILLAISQLPNSVLTKFSGYSPKRKLDLSDRWTIIYYAFKNATLNFDGDDLPSPSEMNTPLRKNLKFSLAEDYYWLRSKSFHLTVEEKIWLDKYAEGIAHTAIVNID